MRTLLILLLMLGGCSKSSDVLEELPNSSIVGAPRDTPSETRMEEGQSRPVTIGEDGPRLDACGAMGRVTRVGEKGLAVRAAPFDEAKEMGRLFEGARAYVCTRSLDQKWLGVVVVPPPPLGGWEENNGAQPIAGDCGLGSPLDRKRAYDGPCASGWVLSAAIRLN